MDKTVDLFMFMGQSNMAGRGIVTEKYPEKAPSLTKGAGYEFRAVSDPNQLYPISEPFGHNENHNNGIDDKNLKTGSMVTAFTNAYYKNTGIPRNFCFKRRKHHLPMAAKWCFPKRCHIPLRNCHFIFKYKPL